MSVTTLAEALASGRGSERPFTCPEHDDTNPSASVNVLKGVWYCYVCFAHGTIEGHVPSADEALAILKGDAPPRVFPEAWLDVFDADHASPYWSARYGIEVASAHRCGTDPESGRPTYPIRDSQGRLLGVVERSEDTEPKYRYPWNTSTSQTLYGALRPAKVVVLVEGASDVMAFEAAQAPGSWTVLGAYGAGIHHPQISLVASCEPKVVITAFDDDEAGHKAHLRSVGQLADIAPVLSVDWASVAAKDAGAAPPQTRLHPVLDALRDGGFARLTKEVA